METLKNQILTKYELLEIEKEIDHISARAEVLNPSLPDQAEQLYYDDIQLSHYLKILDSSYKKARISEVGLSIVR